MQKRKRRDSHATRNGMIPAGNHSFHQQREPVAKKDSLDDVVRLLIQNRVYKETLGEKKNNYEIETCLKANHRKWYYRSLVRHKGKEVVDDQALSNVERCRHRATRADKSKILWERFVEEAGIAHRARVREVKGHLTQPKKKKKRSRKVFFPVLTGTVVIVLVVCGLYQVDPKLNPNALEKITAYIRHRLPSQNRALPETGKKQTSQNRALPEQEKPEVMSKKSQQSQEQKTLQSIKRTVRAKGVSPSPPKPVPPEQPSTKAEIDKSPPSDSGFLPETTEKQVRQREETQPPQELEKGGKQRSPAVEGQVSDPSTILEPEGSQAQASQPPSTDVRKQPAPTKERDVPEDSSQEEIRKKINAILGDTNN